MSRETRIEKIQKLQKIRKSILITYVTSTRPNHEIPMAMDAVRLIYDHLKSLGCSVKDTKIDLFLQSNGGDGVVPWRLVSLIREHCKSFEVLIPHRAFSAATLTALGADKIVMHPMGMLGPTDPVVGNAFNPQDPANPKKKLGISVEDVSAYIEFIKKDFNLSHQDQIVEALKVLAEKVHPLALGNVKRFHSQSRMMAKKLLATHMSEKTDQHKMDQIVKDLTSELFFHGHPISRIEARNDIGLEVEFPDSETESLMWALYRDYEEELLLDKRFDLAVDFCAVHPNLPMKPAIERAIANNVQVLNVKVPVSDFVTYIPPKVKGVYVESISHANVFTFNYSVTGAKLLDGSMQISISRLRQGWEIEDDPVAKVQPEGSHESAETIPA